MSTSNDSVNGKSDPSSDPVESLIDSLSESAVNKSGEGEEEEEDESIEPAEAESLENSTSNPQTSSANAKKNKKKKLAARLRKKLGGAGGTSSGTDPDPSNEAQGTTAHFTTSTKSGSTAQFSNDQFDAMRKMVQQETGDSSVASKLDNQTLKKLFEALNNERNAVNKSQQGKQKAQKDLQDHKFWNTQPVIKPGDGPIIDEGPIEPNKPPSEVRSEPYPLPKDFEWVNVDIDDPTQLQELFELLFQNYVEDDDASMRFKYSAEFLHWVLKHPGYRPEWHLGVRVTSSRKLVAFISGIPHELRVRETSYHSTEINFLCVHKKLRSKRLAPVLIKEVTRQCNLTGIFQAIYTGGIVLPTPISCARYYHRTINPAKLVAVEFAAVPKHMSREAYFKRFDLPEKTKLKGLREMEMKDVGMVGKLMRRYMKRFDMAPRFSDEEIKHLFLSGRGEGELDAKTGARQKQVTWTFVVENPATKVITDMFAFYSLPSSILNHPTENVIHAAYLFYYASDSIFSSSPSSSTELDSDPVAPSSSASTSSSATVEEWQRSKISGLSSKEFEDEKNVQNWAVETREMKLRLKARLNELINDALILSKKAGFDVVNCLTVMDNQLFIQEQQFGQGDGFLRFYLFNWRVSPIAGGMGNKPGESDQDPYFSNLKSEEISKSTTVSNSSGSKEVMLNREQMQEVMSRYPKAEWGSGNGVVMV